MYPTNIKAKKKDKIRIFKAIMDSVKAGIKENVKLFLNTRKLGKTIIAKLHI